jgi:FkbM family methyltransferase
LNSLKEALYKTVDVITMGHGVKRVIEDETVRFPAKWSRYYESDYEPETFKFFRKYLKPDFNVLDIGAHIGLFSVLAARIVAPGGKVFSFEPTPFTRSVLTEVIGLNGVSGAVEVRSEAVSNRSGTTIFYDTGDEISNANSLVHIDRGKTGIGVQLTSIDHFVEERGIIPDCIKIDVEGAELDLLEGARKTFTNARPFARLGLHPPQIKLNGQSLEDVWKILGEFGYEIEFKGNKIERSWFCSQPELFDVNLIPAK